MISGKEVPSIINALIEALIEARKMMGVLEDNQGEDGNNGTDLMSVLHKIDGAICRGKQILSYQHDQTI